MVNACISSLAPVKKSFWSEGALVSITNVAQQRRLNQAAAQTRRWVCCAQTRLDAEHGATPQLCIEYLPPRRRLASLIPQLS